MIAKGCGFKTGAPAGLALIVLLFVLAACGANNGVVRPDYSDELDDWTRSVKVLESLETKLYFSSTYKSPSFREAYIYRYVESYGLTDAYLSSLLEREQEQAERYNEFFFTAYTPVEDWNDFDQKDSIWKLYLEDDTGARLSPISVTKLDTSETVLREFFPYYDLWSKAYVVKFPKYSEAGKEPIPGPETAFIRLIATGVVGKGQLEWRMK